MAIPVKCEPEDSGPPMERCVFCRCVTPFWTELPDRTGGEQAACCSVCAEKHDPAEVPTKKEWWEKEKAYA